MGLINYIHEKRLEKERAERNEKIVGTLKVLAGVGAGFTLEKISQMPLKKDLIM